ncbi:RHS repeat domain-containing protein [Erwinia sorbitola]|nr:RHS repeat-associated core domain-containing protein [Erwinia sorbitola]
MTLTTGQEAGGYGVRQDTRWEYDGADRVLARYAEGREEAFRWDASGNLLNGGAVAWNDQVSRAGDYRHEWDEFGRLARRISVKDSAVQHLHYDGDGRVTSVTFSGHPRYREVCYDYDGLGRRTAKTVKHVSPYEPDKRTDFYWQGMRLSAEQGTHEALTFHFYHGESHTPLARYDSGEGGMRYVHAEVNGMPQALSDREGNTVWRPLHTGLFGVIRREESRLSPYAARQNLRFAGQYYDEETGLHYNPLRYYDPGSGSFTQPDPIGLRGGINLYAYGPNPLTWIDPLGLSPVSPKTVLYSQNDINPIFDDGRSINDLKHRLINDPSYINQVEPIRKVRMLDLPANVQERLLSQGAHKHSVFSLDNRRLYAAKEAGISKIPSRWATPAELAEIKIDRRFTTQNGGESIGVRGCH